MKLRWTLLLLLLAPWANGQDLLDQLGQIRQDHHLPALGYAVVSPYNVLNIGVNGYASLADSSSVSLGSRFHLGQNAQTITALMAFEMVKRGKLRWDSRVVEILPEMKRKMHPAYRDKTLADLLSHRSGLPEVSEQSAVEKWAKCSKKPGKCRLAFTKKVLQQAPVQRPDSNAFSNSADGYVVVAAMLERVGDGLSFENLIELYLNQVFKTEFKTGWPIAFGEGHAAGHFIINQKATVATSKDIPLGPVFAASEHMNGSLYDQALLLQGMLVALATLSETMTRDEALNLMFGLPGHAYGWYNHEKNGMRLASRNGSSGSFYTRWVIYDDFQRGFVVSTNAVQPAAANAVQDLLEPLFLGD